jgi:hypothetical protein
LYAEPVRCVEIGTEEPLGSLNYEVKAISIVVLLKGVSIDGIKNKK